MTQMLQQPKSIGSVWTTGWCVAVGLFGIMLIGGAVDATSGPIRWFFTILDGPGELDLNPHMRFVLAILGAVTIGWMITLVTAIRAASQLDRPAGKSIWLGLTASIVIWYAIDSMLSIVTGFWHNAISNTIITAAFAISVFGSGVLRR